MLERREISYGNVTTYSLPSCYLRSCKRKRFVTRRISCFHSAMSETGKAAWQSIDPLFQAMHVGV